MLLKEAMAEAGIDGETLIARFAGNEALAARFLKKFISDPTYGELSAFVRAADPDAAFSAAHTLKGVAGNLGMDKLYGLCSDLVEYLRAGGRESGKINDYFGPIETEYNKVCEILKKID